MKKKQYIIHTVFHDSFPPTLHPTTAFPFCSIAFLFPKSLGLRYHTEYNALDNSSETTTHTQRCNRNLRTELKIRALPVLVTLQQILYKSYK